MVSIKPLALCGALLGVSGTALAEFNFYLGADAGYADIELKELKDSESYQGYAGFAYNNLVGLEVGYGSWANSRRKLAEGDPQLKSTRSCKLPSPFMGPCWYLTKPGYMRATAIMKRTSHRIFPMGAHRP